MRYLFYVICIFNTLQISAQVDMLELIEFKAKLLTTSRYGMTDAQSKILENISKQEVEHLKVPLDRFVFLKIRFDQTNDQIRTRTVSAWIGSCDYYVAYNYENSKFYRLGGFDSEDVSEFFRDLRSEELIKLLDIENTASYGIDFLCLKKYNDLSERKKRRRGYNCSKLCSDELSNTLTVH
ncbi:MAG: hypothetical protein IPL46_10115 [Saprospiraceae bacterium]|nr:hypothetical protein [Saprospiraceae bacterium]